MARKSQKKSERVTQAALARALGVTSHALSAAKKIGRIRPGDDGLYDLAQATRDFESSRTKIPGPGRGYTQVVAGADPSPTPSSDGSTACPSCGVVRDLTYWRTRSEREGFLKRRLERLELQGALVKRSQAEAALASLGAMMRTLLEGIGGELRDELAAESDPRRCGDLVGDAIRAALNDAADRLGGLELDELGPEALDEDE